MLNAFLIFAMTLFAVVVLHEFEYVPSCRHGLIKMEGTPVDTDQPRCLTLATFPPSVNHVDSTSAQRNTRTA